MGSIDEYGTCYNSAIRTRNGYQIKLSFLASHDDKKNDLAQIPSLWDDYLDFGNDIAEHLAIFIDDFGLPRIDDFFFSKEGYHHVKEVTVFPIKNDKKIWVTLYSEG